MARDTNNNSCVWAVCEMLQGMEGGWVVIAASHMIGYGLNVTCHVWGQFVKSRRAWREAGWL